MEWTKIETIGRYTFWELLRPGESLKIYQVTEGEKPTNNAGYFDLEYLKKIKNVNRSN